MPTYILQKDLPNIKAGAEFDQKKINDNVYYAREIDSMNDYYHYHKNFVENNPEWFKLKEEKMYITNIHFQDQGSVTNISFTIQNVNDKKVINVSAIIDLVEKVLNRNIEQENYPKTCFYTYKDGNYTKIN